MKKADLIESLRKEFGISRSQAKLFVESFFDHIVDLTAEGGRLELRGFGIFKIKRLSGRFIKNPRTGVEMFVEERPSLVFKPSSFFRKRNGKG